MSVKFVLQLRRSAMFITLRANSTASSGRSTCFRRWTDRLRITFRSYGASKNISLAGAINISSLRDCTEAKSKDKKLRTCYAEVVELTQRGNRHYQEG